MEDNTKLTDDQKEVVRRFINEIFIPLTQRGLVIMSVHYNKIYGLTVYGSSMTAYTNKVSTTPEDMVANLITFFENSHLETNYELPKNFRVKTTQPEPENLLDDIL